MRLILFLVLFTVCICTGCDQGDIYPKVEKGTRNVNAQISVTGTKGWPEETYSLVLAVFTPGNKIPADTISLPRVIEGKQSNVTLNGLSNNVTSASICLVRKRTNEVIYTFSTKDLSSESDLTILTEKVDLLPYNRLQKQLFSQCLQCHGASEGGGAANLNLKEEESYVQLVNHPSACSSKMRVQPGKTEESFIIDILDGSGTSHLERPFNHNTGISSLTDDDFSLLKAWISNLPD